MNNSNLDNKPILNKNRIYVIMGPTASHKSFLANVLKDKLGGNNKVKIVNFDAFQCYKEMDIGTAKPSKEELELKSELDNSPTFLLYDYLYPNESMNIYLYQKKAREIISLYSDKYILIFVGGSGLYIKAALFDYHLYSEENGNIKEEINNSSLNSLTNEELYNELLILDKEDALKIGPNNRKRLLRSLFINKYYSKNKSELNNDGKNKLLYLNTKFIYLCPPKEELDKDIRKRVDIMFETNKESKLINKLASLKEEVDYLSNKYDINAYSFKAIGYKEFFNKESNNDLKLIKEEIIKNTIKYAKRQKTFFNHQFNNVSLIKYNNISESILDLETIIK